MVAWTLWLLLSIALAGYFAFRLKSSDQSAFLPGHTTDGHYQLELQCQTCHTPLMGVKEQACLDCHGEDLDAVNDSHPKKKFTDPRNADRVAVLDARKCVTCHVEHKHHFTNNMGTTLPEDFCFHCHEDIGTERPSHASYDFQSCATAGCHNFHDNSALYEDFLAKHLDEPDFKAMARVAERPEHQKRLKAQLGEFLTAATPPQPDALPPQGDPDPAIHSDWLASAHAQAGVNCSGCHSPEGPSGASKWSDQVSHTTCQTCHEQETAGWLRGKHGLRVAVELSPMTAGLARLEMRPESHHRQLNCVSCHTAHRFDTQQAAVSACLECHDDSHSRNYLDSPHHDLWTEALADPSLESTGVSCATCHLPRMQTGRADAPTTHVQHNQNWNLQPNERMIRTVCLQCHGLGFAIDALADPDLIQTNFQGTPSRHIESLDLVRRRAQENQP